MIVRLFRTGGFPPSANEKVVTVDDGRIAVWRSTGVQIAGSFTGQLEHAESETIQSLALRCVDAGDLKRPPVPDAAVDTVILDGARAEVGQHDRPGGPWGELFDHLRPLLERTSQPFAAIGLEVLPSGDRARLRHLGEAPIRVDLSQLRTGDTAPTADSGVVEAGPGWTYEVAIVTAVPPSGTATARVSLVIYDREHPVEVEITASADRPLG
jgi:hypothetical protein